MASLLDWIKSGSGIIGAGINAAASYYNQKREFAQQEKMMNLQNEEQEKMIGMQQEFNKSEREAQNQFNIAQRDYENWWNSPEQQLSRAMQAGINPNSVFGQGQFGAVQSAEIQGGSAQAGLGSAAAIGSIPSIAAAMGNLGNSIFDNALKAAETKGKKIENEFAPAMNDAQIRKFEADIDKSVKDGELSEAQATQIKDMLPLTKQLTAQQITNMAADFEKIVQEAENLKKEGEKIDAETANIKADTTTKNYVNLEKEFEKIYRDKYHISLTHDIKNQLLGMFVGNPEEFISNLHRIVSGIASGLKGEGIDDMLGEAFGSVGDAIVNPISDGFNDLGEAFKNDPDWQKMVKIWKWMKANDHSRH